jgi:uncharacterized membrane protein YqjE
MSQSDGESQAGPVGGLIASVRNAVATLLAIAQTRLEIISTELEEEIGRAANVLLWAFVAVLAAGIGLFLGALVLIFAFWDTHRLLVSLLVMGFFLVLSGIAILVLRMKLASRPPLFGATIAELSRDREHLRQP